MSNADGNISG
ncbi:hypothetical protein YPPY48_3600, partial [Yersinia pestis PY-48]